MPLYDYKCPVCGSVKEVFVHSISQIDNVKVMCDGECDPLPDGLMKRVLNSGVKHQFATGAFFEPYMEEDLGPEPVLIRSVEHLQEECRKRGFGCKKMPPKAAK